MPFLFSGASDNEQMQTVQTRHGNEVAANRDVENQTLDPKIQTTAAGPTDSISPPNAAAPADPNASATPTAENAPADPKNLTDPKSPAVPIRRRRRFRCTGTTIVISIAFVVILLIICMVIGYLLRNRFWPKDHRNLQVSSLCAPFLPLVYVLIHAVIRGGPGDLCEILNVTATIEARFHGYEIRPREFNMATFTLIRVSLV